MNDRPNDAEGRVVARLGGQPDARVQKYFCVDDDSCRAFEHVSKDARVVTKTPVTVRVPGGEVSGWIVEVSVPATDGIVRIDPLADTATFTL